MKTKTIVLTLTTTVLISLGVYSAANAASKESPEYKQCTVSFPNGVQSGVCKNTGQTHFEFFTCEGHLVAFVEPGALPTTYGTTCGPNYKGFPGNPNPNK